MEMNSISLGTGFMLLRIGTHGGLLFMYLNSRLIYLYKWRPVIYLCIYLKGELLFTYLFI
jgi:hypothetical protein